jgi:hypothetical protein
VGSGVRHDRHIRYDIVLKLRCIPAINVRRDRGGRPACSGSTEGTMICSNVSMNSESSVLPDMEGELCYASELLFSEFSMSIASRPCRTISSNRRVLVEHTQGTHSSDQDISN